MKVLVFTARDDWHQGAERGQRLVEALCTCGVDAQHVRKFGTLDELLLVAKHKVVRTPLVVVIARRKEIARLPRLAGVEEILRVLKSSAK